MFRLFVAIVGLAIVGPCAGQEFLIPPDDAKPLQGQQVRVELRQDQANHTLLEVMFYGDAAVLKNADVEVRAFDPSGNPIVAVQSEKHELVTRRIYGFSGGMERADVYKYETPESRVAKVSIRWKDEEVVFASPSARKHPTQKKTSWHGNVRMTLSRWPNLERRALEVRVSRNRIEKVRYEDVSLSVLDEAGEVIPGVRKAMEQDTYIQDGEGGHPRTGLYEIPPGAKAISKVVMKWDGEEVEFSLADMTLH